MTQRLERGLLAVVLVSLPLSTGAHEVAVAVATIVALVSARRLTFTADPWARPAIAAAIVWVALSPASGNVREGFGHAWLLAPLLAIPVLRPLETGPIERWGIGAACVAATWGITQRATGGVGTAGMSHHLSLAYALLPALGVAITRRWWGPAALLAGGVLSTGSSGALIALVVTGVAALPGRRVLQATGLGALVTIAGLTVADGEELRQRAILWTGGLRVAAEGPAGPGAYPAASAPIYEVLSPGFWFPNHAHDSAIQLLAVLGPAGVVATGALLFVALTRGAHGPAAGIAGVVVGALTQDVFGDLEVARACWVWLALYGAAEGTRDADADTKP